MATVTTRQTIDDISEDTGGHNSLRDAIIALLRPYVRERGLGCAISEIGFDCNGNVPGPGISFFSALHYRQCGTREAWIISARNRLALLFSDRLADLFVMI